jgi:hypothetical protein
MATALKILTGNRSKKPLNPSEPQPGTKPAEKPAFLKGRAAKIWDEYAPKFAAMGTLGDVDGHLLAAWCALTARIEAEGADVAMAVMGRWQSLGASLGIGAAERARIVLPKKEQDEVDDLQRFLKRKRG